MDLSSSCIIVSANYFARTCRMSLSQDECRTSESIIGLRNMGSYPGTFFIIVNEGNHIHLLHDYPYFKKFFRCRWAQNPEVNENNRRNLRRVQGIPGSILEKYTSLRKWSKRPQIWCNGMLQRYLNSSKIIRCQYSEREY
ncbi:hypothetical protein CDAR_100081 [Caerostris darwini]|uniref:Uncharacterized protein n=1 Tax=Caerostris darwini TaxID=1538125 RepID=A0AAV4UTD0_9ARAC|nr:hypothetical protein CDAR_100081 [Caerostris darwini]